MSETEEPSERETKILACLERRQNDGGPNGDGWLRPMDVGGSNGSHHHSTLKALVKRGLVAEKRRVVSIQGAMGSTKAGKVYRFLRSVDHE